jgi:CheY-like chemotaxis protein
LGSKISGPGKEVAMTPPRILLAEDDDAVRGMLQQVLERDGFEVVTATGVSEALGRIAAEHFDVLLSDLHMPSAGDGFTVVSAMRHTHPRAVTLILSGYPEVAEAMSAILSQADEVLVKPIQISSLREIIHRKLATHEAHPMKTTKSVATILEDDLALTIQNWMGLVERNDELTCISLSFQDRTGYLPQLLRDLIYRLRLPTATNALFSVTAREHGQLRHRQGYSPAMVVEESRLLQVSIFSTLQNNLRKVDFSKVLLDVITIADEVDSQLKQAMLGYADPKSTWSAA